LISIDVGNSSVGLGFRDGDGRLRVECRAEPEAAAELVTGAAAAISVAPERLERLQRALAARGLPPARVLPRPPAALRDSPPGLLGSAGSDRLANVLALLPGPGVVVDAGTAVTVDLVDASGHYRGGFIAAGPAASAAGLARVTACLPGLPGARMPPRPGLETADALGAGLWAAAVGGVDRLVAHALRALGARGEVRLVATGGWGPAWAADSEWQDIEVVPGFVHEGIARWAGWS
jgi:type III pantothenate kinase